MLNGGFKAVGSHRARVDFGDEDYSDFREVQWCRAVIYGLSQPVFGLLLLGIGEDYKHLQREDAMANLAGSSGSIGGRDVALPRREREPILIDEWIAEDREGREARSALRSVAGCCVARGKEDARSDTEWLCGARLHSADGG